jgi:hypothetical protein
VLDRGKCERFTGCAVVQYYNVRLKDIGNGAAATGIVALEKRDQCLIGETVSDIKDMLWCNITI